MGGMMSGGTDMWPWAALWIFLGYVVAVSAGIAIARTVGWHKAEQPQITPPGSTGTQRAWDALRLRYARGEISREEYLQGKVELEDLLQATPIPAVNSGSRMDAAPGPGAEYQRSAETSVVSLPVR